MHLDSSSDDLQNGGAIVVDNSPFCTIYNLTFSNPSDLSEIVCRHTFYKVCISIYIKTHSDCPSQLVQSLANQIPSMVERSVEVSLVRLNINLRLMMLRP